MNCWSHWYLTRYIMVSLLPLKLILISYPCEKRPVVHKRRSEKRIFFITLFVRFLIYLFEDLEQFHHLLHPYFLCLDPLFPVEQKDHWSGLHVVFALVAIDVHRVNNIDKIQLVLDNEFPPGFVFVL